MFGPRDYRCGTLVSVAVGWGGAICSDHGDKSHVRRLLWSHGRLLSSYQQKPIGTTGIDSLPPD
eukprot:8748062-Pyramimonas_sp.AAC.1